jgi:polyphosphate kinase
MRMKNRTDYLNRELSWIAFNRRVLDLALDPATPLLERLKFLSITSSNFDEFFMVRVGELQMLLEQKVDKKDHAGLTVSEQLAAIAHEAHDFVQEQGRSFAALSPLLAAEGIRRLFPEHLSPEQARHAERVFTNEIFPVVSPIAVASTNRLPPLAGVTIHCGVRCSPRASRGAAARFVVVPLPRPLGRIVPLPSERGYSYVLLEDLVAMYCDRLFPGETVVECVPFRITRNAAMTVEDELAADLLAEMADMIVQRRKSDCLRLELRKGASPAMIAFLQRGLRLAKTSIYFIEDVLDYTAFMRLTQLSGYPALKDDPWDPVPFLSVKPGAAMVEAISRSDILLHQPYEAFDPVVRFLEEAADDPDVIAIKQTLYRTSKKSRIIEALARAAENGKYVTAIVELKARFDEERNIGWARRLEDAGVQVIYGIKRYKTHAKVCLVIRKEAGGVKKYVHFGTGNYNEITAQVYTDVGILTCHEDLAADASAFFNVITGHTQPQMFRKIAAAPIDLRETVIALIRAEAEHARQGHEAFIKAKFNALVDRKIIGALYAASQAGVKIMLNVRGICCLRPGVKGLSENITVVSIVDRFLEHSRIFWFKNGGEEKFYISSADWMPRNLDKRCELFVPIEDPRCRQRLREIVETCFRDNVHSWALLPDGSYKRNAPGKHKKVRCQEALYRRAKEAAQQLQRAARTEFATHHHRERT